MMMSMMMMIMIKNIIIIFTNVPEKGELQFGNWTEC